MGKYNLTEKKEKNAAYRSLVRAELVDELYEKILKIFVVDKKYRDPEYSAKKLAEELKTNTRYISAVVNIRLNQNKDKESGPCLSPNVAVQPLSPATDRRLGCRIL